jgi:ribosomal protein S18 acetylase RimI-like enzyme
MAPEAAASVERARPEDLSVLVPMVMDFHAHERIHVDTQLRNAALRQALAPDGPGRILLALDKGQAVGYAILGFGFSVEFGGRDAFIDEIYVVPDRRGSGVGRALLAAADAVASENGVQALHLEADHANERAAALYRRLGFVDHPRHLMTKRLGGSKPGPTG